jgi:hypothetical protein
LRLASEEMNHGAREGYRMIEGKAFLLDHTCSGVGPDDTKAKLAIEKQRKESLGLIVRFIKRCTSE